MIFGFIALIGLFFGIFLAYFIKEEIEPGRIYFLVLEIIVLMVLILFSFKFQIISLIFGLIFGFIIKKEYFYFGIGLVSSTVNKDLNFLYSSLVFVYGMPYGSLLVYEGNLNKLYLDLILFLVPLVLYLFNFNLLYFACGGLIAILLTKIAKLIKFR